MKTGFKELLQIIRIKQMILRKVRMNLKFYMKKNYFQKKNLIKKYSFKRKNFCWKYKFKFKIWNKNSKFN